MPIPYILAIDLGTSGPKVALVSVKGEVAGYEYHATETHFLPGGGAEQDPEAWWRAVLSASRRLLERELVNREHIIAISCTSMWSSTVALDGEGRPLRPAMIWMDARGAPYVDEISRGFPMVEGYSLGKLLRWIRQTGGAPAHSGKDSLAHILYLKAMEPEVYANTHCFLEPKDYLNFRFTGRMVSTYDALALHWVTDNRDIHHIHYDERLIRIAGLKRKKLPDLVASTDIVGSLKPEVAATLGLREDVVIVGGTPDVQSAAIGSGAVRDGEGTLCLGTSSFITSHVGFKKTDLFHNMASLPSGLPGKYFIANEQETSGVCLHFLRDKLFFPDDELESGKPPEDSLQRFDWMAAAVPPGSGGVIFTPWLYGERTPVEDHTLRGSFFNLGMDSSRGQIIRAVMEGVAFNSRWLLGYVERFAGKTFDPLHFIGGGAVSEVWCQILADVLERRIWQMEAPRHANARGAAYLAALALDHLTVEEIASQTSVQKEFFPNPKNKDIYEQQYRAFRAFYRNNRKMYAQLNRKSS